MGAKQRLLPQLIPLLPREFNAYHEPFAGSAAPFFALGLSGKRVHLNDVTAAVASLYPVLPHPQGLKDLLAAMTTEYSAAVAEGGRKGGKAYFDDVRQKYNERPPDTELAAKLVFLMHMSFSSIYSENAQGKARVFYGPDRGKEGDTRFYFPEKIDRAVEYFTTNDVCASCGDFEQVLTDAAAGDFVFMDPPYMGGTFTRYHAGDFTETDHLRGFAAFEELTRRGCKVLLTNANIPEVRELYHNFTQVPLTLARTLQRKQSRAPAPHELAIMNYPLPSSSSPT